MEIVFFLVHPYVISWAMENLKYMRSVRALKVASERAHELFFQSVGDLERVTYWFHIIKKEVEVLAYYMKIYGMYDYPNICICVPIYYLLFYNLLCSFHLLFKSMYVVNSYIIFAVECLNLLKRRKTLFITNHMYQPMKILKNSICDYHWS